MSEDRELEAEVPRNPHRCPFWVQYLLVSPVRRWLEPPDRLVGPWVSPGMTVLDPGCGFGYLSLPLARMVGSSGRVLSVDLEARVVERLLRRARRAGLADRIVARTCEPRDLGLAEYRGQVDLVTAIHVVHELEDLPGFVAQAALLLKPEGRMLVVEPPGHVSPRRFESELDCFREAGYRVLDRPTAGRRSIAALLAPPPG